MAAVTAGGFACLVAPSGAMASAPAAQNLRCSSAYVGGTYANVIVPPNQTCDLTSATVLGNAEVGNGATLDLNYGPTAGTIKGNVTNASNSNLFDGGNWNIGGTVASDQADTIEVGGGTTHNILSQDAQALYVFSTTIDGSVAANDTQIGGEVSFNNLITGDVLLNGTAPGSSTFGIDGQQINGSVYVTNNRSAVDISSNQIAHNLVCTANNPPPVGGANQVGGRAEGQCAAFDTPGSTDAGSRSSS